MSSDQALNQGYWVSIYTYAHKRVKSRHFLLKSEAVKWARRMKKSGPMFARVVDMDGKRITRLGGI